MSHPNNTAILCKGTLCNTTDTDISGKPTVPIFRVEASDMMQCDLPDFCWTECTMFWKNMLPPYSQYESNTTQCRLSIDVSEEPLSAFSGQENGMS